MFKWLYYSSYIIFIPAIIAAGKYKTMDKAFQPLAYNLWIGVVTEIIATIFSRVYHNNMYVYNIFMLVDFFTFYWLFYNWGAFSNYNNFTKNIILLSLLAIWILDNIVLHTIGGENIIFRIVYSLFIAMVGIRQFATLYIGSNNQLYTNPFFYITVGVIFYYLYSTFISLFNSPLFNLSVELWEWNNLIYVIINIFTNIMFAISLLWIKKKVRYI